MMVAGASTVAIRTAAILDGVVAGKDESVDWFEREGEFEDRGGVPEQVDQSLATIDDARWSSEMRRQ